MASREKIIGITLGDPAGIGAEVVARALQQDEVRRLARYVIFGDERLLDRAISLIGADGDGVRAAIAGFRGRKLPEGCLRVVGKATKECGEACVDWIVEGIESALRGEISALVTAPINKVAIHLAGYDYAGHTEILREKTGAERAVMMMVGGGLRVSLVTTHIAVADLPRAIDEEAVLSTISITARDMERIFGVSSPRIAVCGLNPHAGEGGRFGREEIEIINPAVEKARERGIDAVGSLPADTVFHQALEGRFDAVVAMFHDQANIPVKTLAFESTVNVTLGLPIIRTSPGHGTAYDIAWKGCADARSMIEAIKLAASARPKR